MKGGLMTIIVEGETMIVQILLGQTIPRIIHTLDQVTDHIISISIIRTQGGIMIGSHRGIIIIDQQDHQVHQDIEISMIIIEAIIIEVIMIIIGILDQDIISMIVITIKVGDIISGQEVKVIQTLATTDMNTIDKSKDKADQETNTIQYNLIDFNLSKYIPREIHTSQINIKILRCKLCRLYSISKLRKNRYWQDLCNEHT
jgi:hypothetical protein